MTKELKLEVADNGYIITYRNHAYRETREVYPEFEDMLRRVYQLIGPDGGVFEDFLFGHYDLPGPSCSVCGIPGIDLQKYPDGRWLCRKCAENIPYSDEEMLADIEPEHKTKRCNVCGYMRGLQENPTGLCVTCKRKLQQCEIACSSCGATFDPATVHEVEREGKASFWLCPTCYPLRNI